MNHNKKKTVNGKIPYMRGNIINGIIHGEIVTGNEGYKQDRFRIDGPLDKELKKILEKYQIPANQLYSYIILVMFGYYMLAWSLVFVHSIPALISSIA